MKKILYWIPTLLFGLTFFTILLVFHPLQVIARSISYQAHKSTVDAMIWCLNKSLLLVGAIRKIDWQAGELPTNRPMIIVSNHQSMFDIPAIGQLLNKHHPKYIAKKSLSKGIPSISYNIRKGGSIFIDRENKATAVNMIKTFCEYLNANNYAGCIFPEGSRSRDGEVKEFKKLGLATMIKYMPDATIVPVVLHNFWKIGKYNMSPIPFGVTLKCTVLPPVERAEKSTSEIMAEIEERIVNCVAQNA